MVEDSGEVLAQYLEDNPEARLEWRLNQKLRNDPRVTAMGAFLRKTSPDELPQLWNVLANEMSLVGPRPIVEAEIPKYGTSYGLYTRVKSGVTGLWQVSGRNDVSYEERVKLDSFLCAQLVGVARSVYLVSHDRNRPVPERRLLMGQLRRPKRFLSQLSRCRSFDSF
jgi:lipopolysaccharide/colanic/teichoic acid biosynthesis glycosyltransferase